MTGNEKLRTIKRAVEINSTTASNCPGKLPKESARDVPSASGNLAEAIRSRIVPTGGVALDLPGRDLIREARDFGL
jgi:hypothetical protein